MCSPYVDKKADFFHTFPTLPDSLDDDDVLLNMCKLQGSRRLEDALCELIDCKIPKGRAGIRQNALSGKGHWHKNEPIKLLKGFKGKEMALFTEEAQP